MFNLLREDINRYFDLEGKSPITELSLKDKICILSISYGLHAVVGFRFACFVDRYWKKNILWKCLFFLLKFFSCIWNKVSILLYGVLISRGAEIGEGLYIGHAGGVLIGPTTIGKNFTLTHNVTVGVGKTGDARGLPTIGDNVWVGTNAVLYGDIHIGSHSSIAPGAIVSKNICEHCLAAGNPARIVQRDYDNTSLLFRTVGIQEKDQV